MFDRAEPILAKVSVPRVPGVWVVEPPVPSYTNRDDYLGEIRRLAEQERAVPAVLALHSRPGMGKTALLRRAAAAVRDLFDIALAVDFGPRLHEGAVEMSDVLAGLLEDLYVDQRWIPASRDGRRRRYLSLLEGQRVLLLLDGVTEPAQVLTLLPNSSQALVIAASERRLDDLAANGAKLLRLEGLSRPHGARLLETICAGERAFTESEHLDRLVDLCDGSPMGLRVIGSRLRAQPALSVHELVTDLERELGSSRSGGTHEMAGLFESTYDALPDEAAHLYRMLGVAPGPELPERVIAAADDETVGKVRPLIATLVEADLLEIVEAGIFRLPELVRVHARGVAVTTVAEDMLDRSRARVVRAWLSETAAADRAVQSERYRVPGEPIDLDGSALVGASPKDAMRWYERRRTTLLAVIRHASAQRLHTEVWRLFEAMWPFYVSHSYLQTWQEAGTLAVAAAVETGDVSAEARVRCLRSRAYLEQDMFDEAKADIDTARGLAESADDGGALFASVLDFSGQYHYRRKEFEAALADFREALDINEKLGDQRGIALQSQFCGRSLGSLTHYDEALAMLDRARRLIVPFADSRTESRIAYSRGEVLMAAGHAADAVESLHNAVDIAAALGVGDLVVRPLEKLAVIAREQGNAEAERGYVQRLLELHASGGSPEVDRLRKRLDDLT